MTGYEAIYHATLKIIRDELQRIKDSDEGVTEAHLNFLVTLSRFYLAVTEPVEIVENDK
jgi:hypothetical protein